MLPFGVANIWDVDDAVLEVNTGHRRTQMFAKKLAQFRVGHH